MPDSFFDTNTLLYSVSVDEAKASRARDLIRTGGTISVQVLNEVANVGRKKMRLDWEGVARLLRPFRAAFRIVDVSLPIHVDGLRLAAHYGFSTYDGMIVAAALHAGCDTLWSEDMHDGLIVDGQLTIRNPFA